MTIQSAIELAGGQTRLAKAIGARQQEVWNWLAGRRVPVHRCPGIERITGVSCESLRPDVRWHRIADPAWPHPGGRPLLDIAAGAPPDAALQDAA